jgi:predicted DNA-binding protein (MmcQ/YjbR family)
MATKKRKSEFAAPLKKFALAFPGAYEDHPWGESVAKVAKKVFVFFGHDDYADFGMSVKLPQSRLEALQFAYTEPTGYGLGKSGWVSVKLADAKTKPPIDMLMDWIEESYRAVAPKKMIAELVARELEAKGEALSASARPAPKNAAKRKAKKSKAKKKSART